MQKRQPVRLPFLFSKLLLIRMLIQMEPVRTVLMVFFHSLFLQKRPTEPSPWSHYFDEAAQLKSFAY
jgi:hypothetical protein